jgi:hypothetical protein
VSRSKHWNAVAAGAATVLAAGGLAGFATTNANAAAPAAAADCGVVFDDFDYSSHTDPAITTNKWSVRTNSGGPGIPGAAWPAENVSFPTVDGQKSLQLTSWTDGTAAGTAQSEFLSNSLRFYEGTYASRVKFADAPVSGNDGDHLVETFFTITPLHAPMDPDYGEIDFEYLPNGGWGEPSNIMYQTTWETYQAEPWQAVNTHGQQRQSFDGWHDLVFTVSAGKVTYYIDGQRMAEHGEPYYPETPMSVNFNLWFIDAAAHTGGRSTYRQAVDYFYYAGGEVLSPAEAKNRVETYRAAGTSHADTLTRVCSGSPTAGPTSSPTGSPTGSPTATPTATPTTAPPTGPADCSTAPAWAWNAVYLEGQQVRHTGKLWQANWWTRGSEPGLTAQWSQIGTC